ncbi:MAG: APC family permease [Gemmatimonadales bacterium]
MSGTTPVREATPSGTSGTLSRSIGTAGALATLVGVSIGSGIFRVPSTVAREFPSPTGFMLVWVVGGIFTLAGALTFGELASTFPVTGGTYVYLREGVGPLAAFVCAWTHLLFLRPVALGAVALVFASYVGKLIPAVAAHEPLTASGLLIVLAAINYRSVRLSTNFMLVTGGAKAVAVVLLAALLLVLVPGAPPEAAVPAAGWTWHGFWLATTTVMFTFSGWSSTSYIAGEVRKAERAMPLVLASGVGFIVVLFLVLNLAYTRALPMSAIAASNAVASDAAVRVFGAVGQRLVVALVVLATVGSLNGTMLSSPRQTFAMGIDTPGLARLGAIHRVYQTPYVAIVVTALLGVVAVWSHTFEQLASSFVFGSWVFYFLCVIGLFRMRRRRPDLPRPFRVPGYPVVPALLLVASVGIFANVTVTQPRDAMIACGLMLVGVATYYLLRRMPRLTTPG